MLIEAESMSPRQPLCGFVLDGMKGAQIRNRQWHCELETSEFFWVPVMEPFKIFDRFFFVPHTVNSPSSLGFDRSTDAGCHAR